jgi:hypothetical protein
LYDRLRGYNRFLVERKREKFPDSPDDWPVHLLLFRTFPSPLVAESNKRCQITILTAINSYNNEINTLNCFVSLIYD